MRVEKQKMKQPNFGIKSVSNQQQEEESRTSSTQSPVTAEKQFETAEVLRYIALFEQFLLTKSYFETFKVPK
ncbi:hypothetical protein L2E82_25267 [Cichorium intybus]|uniref:Uncharacterized protein n=1 Tax=Cichorium intybus TaxID=13427 RepID=A0ACB9E441_CICIN|nr:hypothetical protein L2E82_25267 [Cichorium intybus]